MTSPVTERSDADQVSLMRFSQGSLKLKNRLVVGAHSYCLSPFDEIAYVGARIEGGFGLVILGETDVSSAGISEREMVHRALAPQARSAGCVLLEQIYHPGGQSWNEDGRRAVAPSAVPHARSYVLPVALTVPEIQQLSSDFAAFAARVVAAGAAGVEVKADQGKLHHQFLSPRYNLRDDMYAPDPERGSAFLVQTFQALRAACPGSVLGLRLPGTVSQPDWGGQSDVSVDLCARASRYLAELDLVDYVSISGQTNSTGLGYAKNHGDSLTPEGYLGGESAALSEQLDLPVVVSGRVPSAQAADRIILAGEADLVALTRASIADPAVALGRDPDSDLNRRPCTYCNIACVGNTWYGRPVRCVINPHTGRERGVESIGAVGTGKRVAIVGGGPAGIESAIAAAGSGFSVDLFEREESLGGRLRSMMRVPDRRAFIDYIDYAERELSRLNVTVTCGVDLAIANVSPVYDGIVIATGGVESRPQWPLGTRLPLELTPSQVLSQEVAGRTAVVVDGERFGDPLGIASYLTGSFEHVIVASPFDAVGLGTDPVSLSRRLCWLSKSSVEFRVWVEVLDGSEDSVRLHHHMTGEVEVVERVDLLVWCLTPRPTGPDLAAGTALPVAIVGDAAHPRGLEVATHEGSVVLEVLSAQWSRA